MFNKLKVFIVSFIIWPLISEAIILPAPPPELPETLTQFRTKEQLNEAKNFALENEDPVKDSLDPKIEVSGDDISGVLRYGVTYTGELAVGVPFYGISIIRFYDLQGVPWAIQKVVTENNGISAEITASPSELLIKQNLGASTVKMVVILEHKKEPLIIHLSPVKLARNGVLINTILNAVKVEAINDATGYIFPKLKQIAKDNPLATKKIKASDNLDFSKIENNLLKAIRSINNI